MRVNIDELLMYGAVEMSWEGKDGRSWRPLLLHILEFLNSLLLQVCKHLNPTIQNSSHPQDHKRGKSFQLFQAFNLPKTSRPWRSHSFTMLTVGLVIFSAPSTLSASLYQLSTFPIAVSMLKPYMRSLQTTSVFSVTGIK